MHPGCIHILINPTKAISSSGAISWQQLLKRAELWLEHVWIFEFGSQHIEEAA
ncbi:MAG: hypothetical protein LR015_04925 [Verrucomicrobia bacterium]|nr:hypothetical protein [Verrucomicrobiota bacterium]